MERSRAMIAVGRNSDFDFDIQIPGVNPWKVQVRDGSNRQSSPLEDGPPITYDFPTVKELGTGWGVDNYATSLSFGDVDGDFLDELVVTRKADDNARVIIYDDAARDFAILGELGNGWDSDNYATSVAVGDVNGDDNSDILVGRNASANGRVILYQGLTASNPFETLHEWGSGWGSSAYATAVALGNTNQTPINFILGGSIPVTEYVGCSDPKLVGFTRFADSGDRVFIYNDPTSDIPWFTTGSGWGSDTYATGIAFGDIDGEGCDNDFAFTRFADSNERVAVFGTQMPNSTSAVTPLQTFGEGWGSDNYATSVAFGDIDGDGRDEIAVTRKASDNERVFLYDDAVGGFALLMSWGSGWGSDNYATSVAFGNIDTDPSEEIAFTRRSGGNERIFMYDDAATGFQELATWGEEWITNDDVAVGTDIAIGMRSDSRSDIDGDGLLDEWERRGLDFDCDTNVDVDLPTMGASENHKDIFVELDWTDPRIQPTQLMIRGAKAALAGAPVNAGGVANPDGVAGIRLWVDTSNATDPLGIEGGGSCTDGVDNDGNTLVDGDDPACFGGFGREGVGPCNDNLDNDGDGRRDGRDEDCVVPGVPALPGAAAPRCPLAPPAGTVLIEGAGRCNDTCDNDGNGATDLGDLSCQVGDNFGGGSLAPAGSIPPQDIFGVNDPAFYTLKAVAFNPNRASVFRYAVSGWGTNPSAPEGTGNCGDGMDNDGNFLTDKGDPACPSYQGGMAELGGNDFIEFNHDPFTFVHELGHTLRLGHGGQNQDADRTTDNRNCKPNYVSLMSYDFALGIPQNMGSPNTFDVNLDGLPDPILLDFSPPRHANGRTFAGYPTLVETNLSEPTQLDATDPSNQTVFVDAAGVIQRPPVSGTDLNGDAMLGVDWSADADELDLGIMANVDTQDAALARNAGCANLPTMNAPDPTPMLWHDDWTNIQIPFQQFGNSLTGPVNPLLEPEPTLAELTATRRALNTADLSIGMAGPSQAPAAGETFDVTLSLANAGPYQADGTQVHVYLSSGLNYLDDSGSCIRVQTDELVCVPGALAVGVELGFTVTLAAGDDTAGTAQQVLADITNVEGPEVESADNSASMDLVPTCAVPPQFDVFASNLSAASCQPVALGQPAASSVCGLSVALTNDAPTQFPIGVTLVTWTATDTTGGTATSTQTVTVSLGEDVSCCDGDSDGLCSSEVIYLSTTLDETLGGLQAADEDVVRFDEATNTYSLVFDGSDVGVGAQDLDAFSLRTDGSILMSFADDFTLSGFGVIRDEDIVRFVPSSLGATTAGTFQPFFVGSQHRLPSSADIDGLYEASNGALYLCFRSALTVAGLSIADEDIVRFNPSTNDYSMIFDGSDVGLASQGIDAFNFQEDGSLMLSLEDYPEQSGIPGLAAGPVHNVFRFVPTVYPDSYGPNTSGTFHPFYVGELNGADSSLNVEGFWRERTLPQSVYPAEFAVLGGGTVTETTNAGFLGAAYVNASPNGGSIEFTQVDGGFGGVQTLRLRIALASGTRTGRLAVNGVSQNLTFTSTGSWTTWSTKDVDVTLTGGKTNTIRFETTGEDLANLDQIEVVSKRIGPAVYQAESSVFGGGSVSESTNAGFVGTGYVNPSTGGGYVEFRDVDAGVGGSKTVRFRNALGTSTPRIGRLVINGISQSITFAPTGAWTTWTSKDEVVTLSGGATNTIRLESNGQDLANIDQLEVLDQVPAIPTYQAESALLGGGAALETTNAGFNGGGYVNAPTSGGSIEFHNVEGGAGGSKTLRFRNALASGSRTGRLLVNGSAQNITFTATGSWTTWTPHDVVVTLTSGATNTIRLESNGQDLANLDQLEIH
jgi:hypothetical protein